MERERAGFAVGLAAAVLAGAALACSGGGGAASTSVVSCTIMDTGNGDPPAMLMTCQEASGLSASQAAQLRDGCIVPAISVDAGSTAQAHFENGPCSREHALGGCASAGGNVVATSWYYENGSQTADGIRALCQRLGATFVAP